MTNSSAQPDFSVSALRQPLRVEYPGIWGAPEYTNWIEESMSWKETCYLGDWTFLPGLRYTGPDVLRLFSDISVNTMENFAIGQSKHVIHCNVDGKLIEEGVLSRFGEQDLVAFSTFWADFVRRQGDYDVQMEAVDWTKFHLQGPNALWVLEKVTGEEMRDLRFMRFRDVTVAGHRVTALRQGMTGEIGFELQTPIANGEAVRAAILEAGQEAGIKEMGGRVAMINHLEACYPSLAWDYLPAIFHDQEPYATYARELVETSNDYFEHWYRIAGSFESDDVSDWYRSPVEFGWGNRINFDHEFLGDVALRDELANPKRSIATLVWSSEDVIDIYASLFRRDVPLPDFMELPNDPRGYMYSDKVLDGSGNLIGATSARGYSVYSREMLSLAVLDVGCNVLGEEVVVIWGGPGTPQREIRATVAPAPYKKDRGRVDFSGLPRYRRS